MENEKPQQDQLDVLEKISMTLGRMEEELKSTRNEVNWISGVVKVIVVLFVLMIIGSCRVS